jgi:adenylylsulfate kinase-like enzyme
VIVVITGPIASGKSTVAREALQQLERRGVRAAVIDLDAVHDEVIAGGSPSGDATWTLARQRAASQAKALTADGVTVVIAEGSFNLPIDRAVFAENLDVDEPLAYVTLEVSFEEALRRAQRDPTRGRSRDPAFLASHFASRREVLAAPPATDLVIDTERMPATEAGAMISALVMSRVDVENRRRAPFKR